MRGCPRLLPCVQQSCGCVHCAVMATEGIGTLRFDDSDGASSSDSDERCDDSALAPSCGGGLFAELGNLDGLLDDLLAEPSDAVRAVPSVKSPSASPFKKKKKCAGAPRGPRGNQNLRRINGLQPEAIARDIANGCGCRHDCLKKIAALRHYNLQRDILETRTAWSRMDNKERRGHMREYLEAGKTRGADGKWEFALGCEDASLRLCPTAFAVRTGAKKRWVYKQIEKLREGIRCDDPGLGGLRVAGRSGAANDDESVARASMEAFCRLLKEEAEWQPVSDTGRAVLQLDMYRPNELYEGYLDLQEKSNTPKWLVGSPDMLRDVLRFSAALCFVHGVLLGRWC